MRDFKWGRGIIRFMSMCEVLPFTKARRRAERASSEAHLNRDIAVISRRTIDSPRNNTSRITNLLDTEPLAIGVQIPKLDQGQLRKDIVMSQIGNEEVLHDLE